MEIDDSLYSRQRYVLGDSAMKRMAKASVLITGMGALGVEIAKNVVLAGVKSLTVQDGSLCKVSDVGTNFFVREEDVTKQVNRAVANSTRLAELNPYVSLHTRCENITMDTDMNYLKEYQCVILTEASLSLQLKVNEFCRSQTPPVCFITADVYGVFSWSFCDFGDDFEIVDANGEEPKEVFVSNISKGDPGVVTTLENRMHGLEDGDSVTFKEVAGMDSINGQMFQIKVISPYRFSIGNLSGSEYEPYLHGGIATQIKVPKKMKFEPLAKQLSTPSFMVPDLSKFEAPLNIHVGMRALYKFMEKHGRLPGAWNDLDAVEIIQLSTDVKEGVDTIDESLIKMLSYTSAGQLVPLCAALGGFVAQEALKAITGKFSPLQQWLHLDAREVCGEMNSPSTAQVTVDGSQYDPLRICIGNDLIEKLQKLNLFMVGCGAIGCEMLKNYALLGVSVAEGSKITITDNDLIEKSNLNRQFLFRPHHIRKPKSVTAAAAVAEINPRINIEPHQHKVCPQTEATQYNDTFFEAQDIVVNALDNVEARRYVDSRCVTNGTSLLESGTMGTKGHVQVVVPHLTESYGQQRDPVDDDVPYCTLKSFPAIIEHCIQWSRDKFESSYVQKPAMFNKFWDGKPDREAVIERLAGGAVIDGAVQVSKLATCRPTCWPDCVSLARCKFEKYFNHKARHLLHAFPADTRLKDGTLFWQLPKRPPTPLEFDSSNTSHMAFVCAAARLYADICGLSVEPECIEKSNMISILANVKVPPFKPSSKSIETDESAKKAEAANNQDDDDEDDELQIAAARFKSALNGPDSSTRFNKMCPAEFEKDDDSNGHIDYITAGSNLRAAMYNIEAADRLKTKRIAGRIVPAIATTTAAVAGLVTIELIKVVRGLKLEAYKNCFLNLALPIIVHSEPGPAPKSKLSNGLEFTSWDRWSMQGRPDMTLQQFLQQMKIDHGVDASMVVQGVKMVYVPLMPGHKKRLPKPMIQLLRLPPADAPQYVDLVVSFAGPEEDEMGPPVRYFIGV